MKPHHVEKLLANYPLGTVIKFEKNLSLWKKLNDKDNDQLPKITSNLNTPIVNTVINTDSRLIQVDHVLSNSSDGVLIVNYFKTHGELNDNIRGKLVDLIIHNLIANAIPMSITLADNIANQIVFMFPSELKVSTYLPTYKKIIINYFSLYIIL